MTITKMTPEDAGCYVDGHWGQYGTARMIKAVAATYGYDTPEAIELAGRKLDEMFPTRGELLSDDDEELLSEYGDLATEWLNENVAPEDYWFGWHDGEFFLGSVDFWDEDCHL